ncbi:MAG TPA: hypothetical protein VHO03_15680 [Ignavibacteriales bacterium]|nr:hypothetical protein [Ignavibacteriales bacterium]
MLEIILNIYLIINNGFVVAFKAKGYEMEGGDNNKIDFLKRKAREDFEHAYHFDAPQNKRGEYMKYNKFARLEQQGMQYQLFEEIFQSFKLPEQPLICVTPVVNGKIISEY